MIVSLIAAMAENRVIGREGAIPWDIPEDRKRFREITMGHPLIMGRKTYESIGRPLQGRKTVILTRRSDYRAEGCLVAHDLRSALVMAGDAEEVFVCGGGEVYREALPLASRIYLTVLHREFPGDAFFPDIPEEFVEVAREEIAAAIPCTFTLLARREGRERPIRAVLFDFGGVLAEEGFREGLHAIARRQGLEPEAVHRIGMDAVYDSGYVLGRGSEEEFWRMMRERTGIRGDDGELTGEILSRFILRPGMMAIVRTLRAHGVLAAILSDQTHWLERLDARYRFFREFDRVFNSYRLGKGKRDPTLFDDAVAALGVAPCEALFVDDMASNVERARARGLSGIVFSGESEFRAELEGLLGRLSYRLLNGR